MVKVFFLDIFHVYLKYYRRKLSFTANFFAISRRIRHFWEIEFLFWKCQIQKLFFWEKKIGLNDTEMSEKLAADGGTADVIFFNIREIWPKSKLLPFLTIGLGWIPSPVSTDYTKLAKLDPLPPYVFRLWL